MENIGEFDEARSTRTSDYDGCQNLYVKMPGSGLVNIKIHNAMTGNCQLFSVAYMNNLLGFTNFVELIREIRKKVGKKLMLVDISTYYKTNFLKYFDKSEVVMCNDYRSTNGSDMCIIVVNVQKMLIRVGKL